MKHLVIYHANCTDGFGAAFAAWRKLGEGTRFMPMHYGSARVEDIDLMFDSPEDAAQTTVYILDFSFPKPVMLGLIEKCAKLVWLDHHKTAFEEWGVSPDFAFHDRGDKWEIILHNERSGALLAWKYFHENVPTPMVIQHIDDRDRWVWHINGSREIHAALQTYQPWTLHQWMGLTSQERYGPLLNEGSAIIRALDQQIMKAVRQSVKCTILGHTGLSVNCSENVSEVGHELAKNTKTYGLVWTYDANTHMANCSLRSIGELDVSAMAKQFGGGGHKNAAGFRAPVSTVMAFFE